MHRLWSCAACLGSMLVAVLTRGTAAAAHHDKYQIHRLEKAHDAHRRRDDDTCQSGYSLCPASVSGGCCPNNYACEATYCYATTAGPTTACGKAGYYNCGLEAPGELPLLTCFVRNADRSVLGACCPTSYICAPGGCNPPVGLAYTDSCPTSYYLCPSSLGYGCCKNGLACGSSSCYSTEPSTYTITSPVTTTNSAGSTFTSVATITGVTTPAPASVSTGTSSALPKLIPSTISKEAAIPTSSEGEDGGGGGGLTQGQLGGIVGGVVSLFIAVVAAAFFIIRRLKQTARIVEESRRESSAGKTSHKTGFGASTVMEVDEEIDPHMQTPSIRPSHLRAQSDSSVDLRLHSPARSPQLSSGHSTPPASVWPGQYNPLPNMDADGIRHPSIESSTGGYYDPARYTNQYGTNRGSSDSQATFRASRQSNASEVIGSADGAHGVSELDASEAAARRRSSSGATRPPVAHIRRSSDGSHHRGKSDSSVQAAPLGTVSEELHGFYGPQDRTVGQTAARLQPNHSQNGSMA
ncbi:uncharacterized protein BCR38DRAFT_412257 [Pseudomassariella vexata]|uniref:Mid2 domain-containing protein n=1 Tax=Pseudomassariella vexata TaxID=1141098 RepID=A0A1Y2DLD6_9PEZI|nr:uncharacterized protein BCR38DRAFT_412257 [Pseudomassariella vexata]ORY60052.1 hypothetical protein BCR38DRAFT_412257 [Pseudomassariella vexata]